MVAAEHSLAGHVVILRFYSTGTIIVVFTVPWFAVAVIYSSTHIAGYVSTQLIPETHLEF